MQNEKVDKFIDNAKAWQEEYKRIREIITSTGLDEDFKWRNPCYTFENRNIVLIQGFKDYCAIMYVNGSLLKDSDKHLIQQTEKVQAGRQLRFTSVDQIEAMSDIIRQYIFEAIELEKAGVKVQFKKPTEIKIIDELQAKFDEMPMLEVAFKALTPGRQKAYLYFFDGAKQSKTKTARIEKHIEDILEGRGLNDR